MRKLIKNILRENEWDWVKKTKISIPFDYVEIGTAYTIDFMDPMTFIKEAEKCGVANAEDIAYKTYYVIPREIAYHQSGALYCGDGHTEHFEGSKTSLELSFYDNQRRLIHSHYWIAEEEGVELRPY